MIVPLTNSQASLCILFAASACIILLASFSFNYLRNISACHESCDGDLDRHTALAETQVGECYGEVTSSSNNCKLCDHFDYYPDDNYYCIGQQTRVTRRYTPSGFRIWLYMSYDVNIFSSISTREVFVLNDR